MLAKIIILTVFALILISLGSALVFMIKDHGKSKRTAHALTWRIGLSLLAFILLFVAHGLGLIQPHGVLPNPDKAAAQTQKSATLTEE